MLENKQIDFAKSPHLPKTIWKSVFTTDSPDFIDFYFNEVYQNDFTLLLTLNDQPAAHLQMLPFEMAYFGKKIKASYLSGVSTLPQFRGQGCMDALMRRVFSEQYQNGTVISTLIPAKPDIYLKYGYRFTYFLDKASVHVEQTGVPLTQNASCETLNDIYQRCFVGYNMRVVRTEKHWNTILYEHQHFEKGQLFVTDNAYALVSFYPKTPLIKELGFRDEAARNNMLTALTSQFGTLDILLPGEKTPFAQSRVIHPGAILEILRKRKSFLPFSVRITDPYIEQNNCCFAVSPDKIELCKTAETEMNIADFTLCIAGDKNTLTKLNPSVRELFPAERNYMNLMLN